MANVKGWPCIAAWMYYAAMSPNGSDADLTAVLQWYAAMGVECALGAEPVNWLARGPKAPGAGFWPQPAATEPVVKPNEVLRPEPRQTRAARPAAAKPDAALQEARELAAGAGSLAELTAALAAFDGCALKATAKNLCHYRGAEHAHVMLIGEGPGRDEDLQGKPFVGRAGQLLDKMLAAIDLGEADVHITNIVYWRPPGNRTPTPQESQVCRPFLERQIALVEPDVLVFLGGAAAKQMLETTDGIMRLRGKWRDLEAGGRSRKVMPTLHPAYLLRSPAAKRLAWRDLLAIRAAIDEASS